MDRCANLNYFNGEVLEEILELRNKFFCLHLCEFNVRILTVPNDAGFFLFDERTLSLVLVLVHYHLHLVYPQTAIVTTIILTSRLLPEVCSTPNPACSQNYTYRRTRFLKPNPVSAHLC
jgi:hypothetical protein